ncbi:autophagy protein 5 [Lichtheimia hyalospora FSU 10163]|nr:autophagy protein 5 [Lichtheimia hyalospora FSU 10163]
MLTIDDDVCRHVWNGKIAIQITLDPAEAADKETEPIFIEALRFSYMPLITQEIYPIFTGLGVVTNDDESNEDQSKQVWYDFQGQPLKWHYPIGLLYDMHDPRPELPWQITVHFRNFPAGTLLRNPSIDTAQDMFMAMLKQADFLKHGTTKRVMNLSKNDQTQLWQSLLSDQYEEFWKVNNNLVGVVENELRYIPLRIYLPDGCPVIQEPVSYIEEGYERSLGQVLGEILPDIFPPSENEHTGYPVIHGITLPLDTPIAWASLNLSYADHFLHLIVNKKT